ncbi:cytochrome b561 domain-containing protein [Canna indica]|uniref:Cytochrome b561 domain-containing protein n=1 Tax=Canna indica TaxID=4628 RepID=A0AAQ3JQM0_9LILI|nr:cytochrome b561 domain-containing protein [Canna indica]
MAASLYPSTSASGEKHKLSQLKIIAILMTTAAAVLSLMNFENSFNNTHQRIGLALYALIWIQPLTAFSRPPRGNEMRSIWYFVHWFFGIGICVLGIANIYVGLHVYHQRSSRSVSLWSVLFTVEISIIAFIFLFQDRWDYMVKEGVDEQVTPTSYMTYVSK